MITAETIQRVTRFDGGGLPVTSVYLGIDAERRDHRSLPIRASSVLHDLRPMAKDRSLDREARLSVRGDVERIEDEKNTDRPLKRGALAIFSCSGRGFYEEVELPRRVRDRAVLDGTPWVRPMLAVLDEFHRAVALVVDKESAHMWELYQGEMSEIRETTDEALRKPDFAGWHGRDEYGVHNRDEELAKRHYRKVATTLDDFVRTGVFELLVVGGHEFEVPGFLEFLPHAMRGSVAGTFATDPRTATIGDIRDKASAIVDRYERDEERGFVTQVLDKHAAGGNAVVGLGDSLWAGSTAAVQRLLVHDEATAPGVVCDESGWLAEAGDTCLVCGGPTRTTADVVDELAEAVIDTSGTVEHVFSDTPLQERLVAADLRFPLPPKPADAA